MATHPSLLNEEKRLVWWREARFGMFIHWGLYAIPAGVWQGQPIAGIGEWIMRRARIPVREYEQLAKQFNPVRFDADEWVKLAKEAGMKYIIITSKHHDGFAMFSSQASPYNIVKATPYRRDPMQDLAAACRREGIRLCFYYSQAQDWHHPNGAGNDWDYDEDAKDFQAYLEEKAKPQVRELLTQYGPVGVIWFDTPVRMTSEQAADLVNLVHSIQPDCLVNSRVGPTAVDYESAGDNVIPNYVKETPWETPATLNDTWGFKTDDHNWKSVETLLRLLADIVSKGGNYLLNVGPTATGEIPPPSVERLRAIGRWMKRHGEAIYGTDPSPFPTELEWGAITRKGNVLYLHLFTWPTQPLVIYGLRNQARAAVLLSDPQQTPLPLHKERLEALDLDVLRIELPTQAPDTPLPVVRLELDGPPQVDTDLIQQASGRVSLDGCFAEFHRAADSTITVAPTGMVEQWLNPDDWLSFTFKVVRPGAFAVEVWSTPNRARQWEGGHTLQVSVAGQELTCSVVNDDRRPLPRSPHQYYIPVPCGEVRLDTPGEYTLTLKPVHINTERKLGFLFRSVQLIPV